MVAKITPVSSMFRIFNYNENKVTEKVAELIAAGNYPIDPADLSKSARLNRLLNQIELHPKAKLNSLHISLNFAPSETRLNNESLKEIAEQYMAGIGFGHQPFLVYRHYDAGHPHVHIVTTNVKTDGRLISLHHLGIRKSEPTRKAIEEQFQLVRAEDQNHKDDLQAKSASVLKALYGQSDSKRAIQIVLSAVLDRYKYTSIHELNAVLGIYNVRAEQGAEGSRVHRHGGLLYRILDDQGNTVGVPLKASLFAGSPTLKNLQDRFQIKEQQRQPFKARVRNAIDIALLGDRVTLSAIVEDLKPQGIQILFRQNEEGRIYGLTYIDHTTFSVFNGSDLGKQYSAKGLLERCGSSSAVAEEKGELLTVSAKQPFKPNRAIQEPPAAKNILMGDLISELLRAEETLDAPQGLAKRKRRKKRKKSSSN